MKCPKCKKKLQTRRTLDDTTETKREKFCGKCKTTFGTVEMFKETIEKILRDRDEHAERISKKLDDAQAENQEIGDALHTIIKAGKKK